MNTTLTQVSMESINLSFGPGVSMLSGDDSKIRQLKQHFQHLTEVFKVLSHTSPTNKS
jgi:hypothetical protein